MLLFITLILCLFGFDFSQSLSLLSTNSRLEIGLLGCNLQNPVPLVELLPLSFRHSFFRPKELFLYQVVYSTSQRHLSHRSTHIPISSPVKTLTSITQDLSISFRPFLLARSQQPRTTRVIVTQKYSDSTFAPETHAGASPSTPIGYLNTFILTTAYSFIWPFGNATSWPPLSKDQLGTQLRPRRSSNKVCTRIGSFIAVFAALADRVVECSVLIVPHNMPPTRTTFPPVKAVKTERTHEENQERYVACVILTS